VQPLGRPDPYIARTYRPDERSAKMMPVQALDSGSPGNQEVVIIRVDQLLLRKPGEHLQEGPDDRFPFGALERIEPRSRFRRSLPRGDRPGLGALLETDDKSPAQRLGSRLAEKREILLDLAPVKFRHPLDFGLPQESVIRRKQNKIRKATLYWLRLRQLPMDTDIHFDVLAIHEQRGQIHYDYIEDAF